MGLLGQGWDDPQSMGLLALAGNMVRGDFGGGLLAAGQTMSQAKQQAMQQQLQQMQIEQHRLALEKAKRDDAMEQQIGAAAKSSFRSPELANAMSAGPMPDGSAVPRVQSGFDQQGFLSQLYGINPMKAVAFEQSMAKDTPFNKIDPKDYTRESIAKYSASRNPADLVAARKLDVVNGQAADLYNTAPGTVFDNVDPNKPFNLRGGQAVPNSGFQKYEIDKAAAGAARNKVDIHNVAETEWSKKRAGDFAEVMANINKTSFSAPTQIRKLERMEQLLQGVDGGKLAPTGLEIASAANSLGIKMDPRLGNKEAAQALSREIAGGFRQPGTGPMTDKDFDNFLLQVPDLSKTAEGRKQITSTMKAAAARDIQIGNMARAYVKKNGRLDDNFIEEVSLFVAENPVIQMPKAWKVQR